MDRGGPSSQAKPPSPARNVKVPSGAGRVALSYAAVAAAWITISDLLVHRAAYSIRNPDTLKGLLFVAVTSVLLYGLVHRLLRSIADSIAREVQATEEQAASEARYRTAFVGSPDSMSITDLADGRYVDVNQGFTRISGWPRDEVIGRSALEIGIWHDSADRQKIMNAVRDTGRCENFETQFRTRDGLVIDAVITAHRLLSGDRDCVLMVSRDITNRKRTEQELRKLSMAVEQSPQGIIITDLEGRIEYANQAFLRTTGYDWDEVVGRNPRVLQSGKTPPATYDEMWHALTKGRAWRGEFINRRKDGSEYVEFAIVAPIRQVGGKVTHFVAIKDDVTEKKRLGEELTAHRLHLEELVVQRTAQLAEARRQAEEANLAKSDFLANMSHEIRTPMNAILGFTELLRETAATPAERQQLKYIGDAGRHLMSIINDILDLSKIEAGKLALEYVDFSLASVFEEVRVLIAEQAAAKDLRLTVDCGDVPEWLKGDPTRIRQALLNYAGNAVKFTTRGTVELRARRVESQGPQALIRIEVRDTGTGIPLDKVAQLFQPFQQLDPSMARKHGGTGLGLAITRRLAVLMGGDAGVESVEGQGSTFWFTVRLEHGRTHEAASEGAHDDAASALRARQPPARVLLCEDDPLNQEVARALLQDTGIVIDVACDGHEAVAMAPRGYDLILMDLRMPGMDGIEATRTIRSTVAGASVPVIAMTANAFDDDRRQCFAAGMNDFIAKPVERDRLLALLLKWLR